MNAQIYEEATYWLIRHRESDLDPQEKQTFDAWLRGSPHHVRAYLEMSALWEDVPALDASWNPGSDELITRARGAANVYPLAGVGGDAARPRSTAATRGGRMRGLAIAATILLAALGGASWYSLNRGSYATNVGEQRSIVLVDGSTLELNSHSRVRVRYTDRQRDVDLLEGQALFRVAHDVARPFVVHSGATNVRAIGTEFDVYARPSGTVVTVLEGRVAVDANVLAVSEAVAEALPPTRATPQVKSNDNGTTVFLGVGQQLTIPTANRSRAPGSLSVDGPHLVNVAAETAWTHRTLVFESSPLTDVAEEFNRYNTRQLVITDATLASFRINGMFSSVDPAVLLKFLRAQPELKVEETATEIRISKR